MERQECESGFGWSEWEIPSSDPQKPPYTVLLAPWEDEGMCDCPGYLYRGECRHIHQALNLRCTWKTGDRPKQSPDDCRYNRCPLCGGRTRTVVYLDED